MTQLAFLKRIRSHLKTSNGVDKWLWWILCGLVGAGFLIFLSASIGLLARDGAHFGSVATSRLIAIIIGANVAYIASALHYKYLRRYTIPLLLASVVLTALVFIPGLGL